ncbi:MAG: hydroxyacylglutathione hydrolase [Sedimentisphaerales bacterium]
MDPLITIEALGDNFIYLYQYSSSSALVVDPSDSSSVLQIIEKRKLNLSMILVTHHHWDHTAGVAKLKSKTGCRIVGGDKQRILGIDIVADDGQILTVGDAKMQVITTPGHTRTSVCYYMEPSSDNGRGILWTGDTLFVGGCGRLLECSPQVMWNSLQKLVSLPEATRLYCGHDYAMENYEFALSIEPDNQVIKKCLQQVKQTQKAGKGTVPSTILQEKITNPFLRADTPEIKNALNMPQASTVEVFGQLRRRKDAFY